MSAADKFKIREETISAVRELYPKFIETIRQSNCDKYQLKFNGDTRFTIVSVPLSLTGYVGYYGSSSCSTFRSIGDKKLFEEAFLKVMNKELPSLLQKTAAVLEEGLEKDRSEYIAKLEAELARVKGGEL